MNENELFDAAAIGNIESLHGLLEKDPFLLDRVSYTCSNKTPLHVATMKGHLAFVQAIVALNPELARELDSQQSPALHIASDKGYLEIVGVLLPAAPDMCRSRDFQGENPIHIAAMKGHVDVLRMLVGTVPLAARKKVDGGLTVLHLCVRQNQLEALRFLKPILSDLVNAADDNGDTILHLAVRDKQTETVQYLADCPSIDLNAMNSKGQTALDILGKNPRDPRNLLMRMALLAGVYNPKAQTQPVKWLSQKRASVMVVAILIATMAFQAGVTPPGGVWQEDLTHDSDGIPLEDPIQAGESVMARNNSQLFNMFTFFNTAAFVLFS